MEELRELLREVLDKELYQITVSGAKHTEQATKKKVRPLLIKEQLVFQVSSFVGKQVFHENLSAREAAVVLEKDMAENFRQMQIDAAHLTAAVLVSKKGKVTIKKKGRVKEETRKVDLSHNRAKKYILEEGRPVPFLVDLGVQTKEGKIVHSRYDKFRQINRFLEFIADIFPVLPKDRPVHIIDFGCGKSYLTFAMYYYLKELKGYSIQVIGLDLKKDVIALCSRLSEKFGFENLHFLHGDIAGYEGVDQVDMVVTLHACDTATDFAMAKAVRWGAKVILSVPCCQHELNRQVKNELLAPVLQYGLIKERMAALLTDGIRGQLLEQAGYRCQILEFIDMEHTPKNIMIRAVYQGKRMDGGKLTQMMEELQVQPTLFELLKKDGLI